MCCADIPTQVILPVATEVHRTTNNLSRELQHQLRKVIYDFQRADEVIRQLGAHNSRPNDTKKGSAKGNPPAASHAMQQQQQQHANANGVTNKTAQPSSVADPAGMNGVNGSSLAQPAAGSNQQQANGQYQAANGRQEGATGLKQEANGLKQQAEDALHPAVGPNANPEPVARVQKRVAVAQPQSSGNAAFPETPRPAAKKARIDASAPVDGAEHSGV